MSAWLVNIYLVLIGNWTEIEGWHTESSSIIYLLNIFDWLKVRLPWAENLIYVLSRSENIMTDSLWSGILDQLTCSAVKHQPSSSPQRWSSSCTAVHTLLSRIDSSWVVYILQSYSNTLLAQNHSGKLCFDTLKLCTGIHWYRCSIQRPPKNLPIDKLFSN